MKLHFYIFLLLLVFNYCQQNTKNQTKTINNSNNKSDLQNNPTNKESKGEKETKDESSLKFKLKKFFRQDDDTNLYIILVCIGITFIMIVIMLVMICLIIKRKRKYRTLYEEKSKIGGVSVEVDANKKKYKIIKEKN